AHGDVEQVRLVENDLDDAIADLLLALEHQPAVIGLATTGEPGAAPGVAEGGGLALYQAVELRLGHRAEAEGAAHTEAFPRGTTRRMARHSSTLRCGSSISSSRLGNAQAAPRPSTCSSRL